MSNEKQTSDKSLHEKGNEKQHNDELLMQQQLNFQSHSIGLIQILYLQLKL